MTLDESSVMLYCLGMSKELTVEDLGDIESKAKAARPGPYAVERREIDCGYFDYVVHSDNGDVAWCREELDRKAKANAAYLASLDPATVLALVAECRELRRLKNAIEWMDAERGTISSIRSPSEYIDRCLKLGWKEGT